MSDVALTRKGPCQDGALIRTGSLSDVALSKKGPCQDEALIRTDSLSDVALTRTGPLTRRSSNQGQDRVLPGRSSNQDRVPVSTEL